MAVMAMQALALMVSSSSSSAALLTPSAQGLLTGQRSQPHHLGWEWRPPSLPASCDDLAIQRKSTSCHPAHANSSSSSNSIIAQCSSSSSNSILSPCAQLAASAVHFGRMHITWHSSMVTVEH